MFDRRPSNVFSGGGAAPDRNSTGQTGNKQLRALLHHGQTAKSDLGQDKHPKLIDLAACIRSRERSTSGLSILRCRQDIHRRTVAKRLARHFAFGRSRVLTPVPPDQVWVFFRDFSTPSHRGMSHITDKTNAGSVPTSQYQYHLPSAPILTVPILNLPANVAEKALESLSSPSSLEGNKKYIF
ncbi:hypothetical protein GEV33_010018 [Tenebrio molitor]|uniref:Uncharacterized protein n=1 Tax=Tenebrio molitor TaxID=7067 RepID=A0A8J6HDQ1_TENMO|nr:hypothetical protein GEV33_010018 [Tenebrio molitor]